MILTDQPGRIFAVIFLGPFFIYKGIIYNDIIFILLGIIFILYELFWIVSHKPNKINIEIYIK
tara:strand:- start:148 stop:336 length:189 start_codon:yes stop_codon:yes gene_type:complete